MLKFRQYSKHPVFRMNRGRRDYDTKTKKATLKEHNALFALGLEIWLAIEEKLIIRALLVRVTLLPNPPTLPVFYHTKQWETCFVPFLSVFLEC